MEKERPTVISNLALEVCVVEHLKWDFILTLVQPRQLSIRVCGILLDVRSAKQVFHRRPDKILSVQWFIPVGRAHSSKMNRLEPSEQLHDEWDTNKRFGEPAIGEGAIFNGECDSGRVLDHEQAVGCTGKNNMVGMSQRSHSTTRLGKSGAGL